VANILPVIERSCSLGIVPFITHTRATLAQTQAAIDAVFKGQATTSSR